MEDPVLDGRISKCTSRIYKKEDMDSIHAAEDSVKLRLFKARQWTYAVLKGRKYLEWLINYWLLKEDSISWLIGKLCVNLLCGNLSFVPTCLSVITILNVFRVLSPVTDFMLPYQ